MAGPRHIDALVAEIGSTTTVVSAFDGIAEGSSAPPQLLGQGFAPTSVAAGDVGIGMEAAQASLEAAVGPLDPAVTLATSSAAGGLRMTVHGLTQKMTAMAAREAALGAGGVVELTTAGRLRDHDLWQVEAAAPGLILLAGGVEGGDSEVVRIIDIHAHAFTDTVAASAIPTLEEVGGIPATYDGTLAGLLAEMDRAGIEIAVTQTVATKASQVPKINDWAASIASERIVPFGALHPDTPEPEREVERMASLGLRGVKLHTEYQGFRPDDPRMDPIYEALTAHGMIVLFHAGLDLGVPTDHGRPARFARMLERHPDLRAVLAHMGGWRLWDEVREHLVGLPVLFDTAYAHGYMTDEEFCEMVAAHGADRVLLGTDGPWADMAAEVVWLRGLPLDADDRDAILGGNAQRLLGL
jgi:hypothetical protein